MTVLIVLGSILAFILLLLLAPVSAEVYYRSGRADVTAHYLFLRYDLLKKRPEKKKKEKPVPPPEPETEEKPEKKKESPLQTAWMFLKASRRGVRIFRRHLVFSRVRINLRVGGGDAHRIAETYAKLSAAVTALLDILALAFVLRKPRTAITPDFIAPGIDAELHMRAGIRPLFALAAGISVFSQYLRLQKKRKKRQNKGGKQHERAEIAASHQ